MRESLFALILIALECFCSTNDASFVSCKKLRLIILDWDSTCFCVLVLDYLIIS